MHTNSAIELRDKFLRGDFTALQITNHFLERIDRLDGQVGAFLSVFHDRVRLKAEALDAKKAAGKPLGKLAGIPIAVKDNIHVQGEITTCGSKFLTNYRAPFDSTATRLLEAEDALLIGKTNCDEFGMGSSCENSALKRTNNPWNLNCTPGGSSGGSGAAVAARLCPVALGSDTGGSVRLPASFCGVLGFKPTYGRVSRDGLVAYASSLDVIGPITYNTSDAALIMEVMGQHCAQDSTSINALPEDYLSYFNHQVPGLKIGVPSQFLEGLNSSMKALFDASLDEYKKLGATIVDVDLDILKYGLGTYYILATAEASTNLARYDGIRYGVRSPRAKTLEEVYDFSKEEGFGAEVKRRILLGTFVLSAGYQDAYYKKAQQVRALIIQKYREAFAKCDLIATPVSPFPAFEIGAIKDPLEMYLADIYSVSINLAGLPAVSVPGGFNSDGKPVGLQLIGPQKQDRRVLQAAYAYEQAVPFYKELPRMVNA